VTARTEFDSRTGGPEMGHRLDFWRLLQFICKGKRPKLGFVSVVPFLIEIYYEFVLNFSDFVANIASSS
jgi:hypothetical protein